MGDNEMEDDATEPMVVIANVGMLPDGSFSAVCFVNDEDGWGQCSFSNIYEDEETAFEAMNDHQADVHQNNFD